MGNKCAQGWTPKAPEKNTSAIKYGQAFTQSSAQVFRNVVAFEQEGGERGAGMKAECLLILCCRSTSDLPDCGWVGAWVGCESVPMSLFSLQKREICCRVCLGGFVVLFLQFLYFLETFLTRHDLQEIGKRAWQTRTLEGGSFIHF